MKSIYLEAGKTLKGKLKLLKGDPATEDISVCTVIAREGQSPEVNPIEANIQFEGDVFSFEWDSTDCIADNEMFLRVSLMIDAKNQHSQASVVLYRKELEVTAVDNEGNTIPDVSCSLILHIDDGFIESNPKAYSSLKTREDGSVSWTKKTGPEGKVVFSDLPCGHATIEWAPPYGLISELSWKETDGFTLDGPKRQAAIHALPMVNFIWWGNPKSAKDYQASATALPNGMAAYGKSMSVYRSIGYTFITAPKIQVNYWRQHDADMLSGWLHAKVFQRPIVKLSDLMVENGHAIHGVFMGRGKILDDIINSFSKYYMFSAAKDLIELCIMYKHGGYYFDTTMLLPQNALDFDQVLKDGVPDDIRLPATADGKNDQPKFPYLRNDHSIYGTLSAAASGLPENHFSTMNVDVWSMYAPPRCPALLTMIDSYIERCVNLGLHEYPSKKVISLGKTIQTSSSKVRWTTDWDGTTMDNFLNKICKSVELFGSDGLGTKDSGDFEVLRVRAASPEPGTINEFDNSLIGKQLQINSGANKGIYDITAVTDRRALTVTPNFLETDHNMEYNIVKNLTRATGTKAKVKKDTKTLFTDPAVSYDKDGANGIFGKSMRIKEGDNKGNYTITDVTTETVDTDMKSGADGKSEEGKDTLESVNCAFEAGDVGKSLRITTPPNVMNYKIVGFENANKLKLSGNLKAAENIAFEIRKNVPVIKVNKPFPADADNMKFDVVEKNRGLEARNGMIGALIITAVQDGLLAHVQTKNNFTDADMLDSAKVATEVKKLLWDTKKPSDAMKDHFKPAPVQAYLPEFNDMPKAHSGSWRV